tara:strand:+ start:69 stop:626 length:558 start_codon:yes stop_codon:yes gene_type:complete
MVSVVLGYGGLVVGFFVVCYFIFILLEPVVYKMQKIPLFNNLLLKPVALLLKAIFYPVFYIGYGINYLFTELIPDFIEWYIEMLYILIEFPFKIIRKLFKKEKITDEKTRNLETKSKIPSERRISDKYYQAKKDAGLINVESGGENAGLINVESGGEESGGYMRKFFALFFIILFSLILLIALTS